MLFIPSCIQAITQNQEYEIDELGMSTATILLYETMVLKIQEISFFSRRENEALEWLQGMLHVPNIIAYTEVDDHSYLLMSRLAGKTLDGFDHEDTIIDVLVNALQHWWSLDISHCPFASPLHLMLNHAYENIMNHCIDVSHANEETYSEKGFKDPLDLYQWLFKHQPKEDYVMSHGDFTFENIVVHDGVIGFIDLGKSGIADRWNDVALAYRGLCYHFDLNLDVYEKHRIKRKFFKKLGLRMNRKKLNYYILLDELS